MKSLDVVLLVFTTGKLVCVGATREEDVYKAVEKLVVILEEKSCSRGCKEILTRLKKQFGEMKCKSCEFEIGVGDRVVTSYKGSSLFKSLTSPCV